MNRYPGNLGRVLTDRSSKTSQTLQNRLSSRRISQHPIQRTSAETPGDHYETSIASPPVLLTNPYLPTAHSPAPINAQMQDSFVSKQSSTHLVANQMFPTFRFLQHKPKIASRKSLIREANASATQQHHINSSGNGESNNGISPVLDHVATVMKSRETIVSPAVDDADDFDSEDDTYGKKKKRMPLNSLSTADSAKSVVESKLDSLASTSDVDDAMTIDTQMLPTSFSISTLNGVRAIPQFSRGEHPQSISKRTQLDIDELLPERTDLNLYADTRAQITSILKQIIHMPITT